MENVKIVTGAGPVGATVALQLASAGHSVRLLTRSGSGPEHPLIERRRVDVSEPAQLHTAMGDADTVFHCIHGSKYRADTWRKELPGAERTVLAVAGESGALVVFPESLYAYDTPEKVMTETSSRTASGGKRGVRTELLAARAASKTPTVSVVASDFFGPLVRGAHAGERMVHRILTGKPLQLLGSSTIPHSFTYVPDLAAAMVRAASLPATWNTVLHAPSNKAISQRELASAFAAAAGVELPKVRSLPGWAVSMAGIFSLDTRELTEMMYQFQAPFIMDSLATEKLLNLSPTPLHAAAAQTVQWWQRRR
ncbi:NAD-dependent epimerase/dehydratase family protein [Arthrobacter antibioticus]|uniref:NAD-dependent epimerase/dehydratase family protein n=1 Tax=Arthrobacter sp. H35-MC1 TaxID=3046203 RepID=UPI0024BB259B|nr:NAD-dependent epimerase/dehydratase family protein [Arthrobacter sp. H35-MC1]MDJ0317544.1 NAD-dependent epimerase/dehydratase family protein [Arthrobacter sp. H35-MC1]